MVIKVVFLKVQYIKTIKLLFIMAFLLNMVKKLCVAVLQFF